MEKGLRECCRSMRIGKILIRRDEETKMPKVHNCVKCLKTNTSCVASPSCVCVLEDQFLFGFSHMKQVCSTREH